MTTLGPRLYRSRSPFQGARSNTQAGLIKQPTSPNQVRWATMAQSTLRRYRIASMQEEFQKLEPKLPEYDSKHDIHDTHGGPSEGKVLHSNAAANPSFEGSSSTVATGPQPFRRVGNRKVSLRSRPLSAGAQPAPRPDGPPPSTVRGRSWGKHVDEYPIFTPPEGSRAPTPQEATLVPQIKRNRIQGPRANGRPRVVTATLPSRSCS